MRTYKVVIVNEYGKRRLTIKAKSRVEALEKLENYGGFLVSINGKKPVTSWWK